MRDLVASELVLGVHDVADGGLGLALAEMAVASGVGFRVAPAEGEPAEGDPPWPATPGCSARRPAASCWRSTRPRPARCSAGWPHTSVPGRVIGTAGGDRLVVEGVVDVALADAVAAWRGRLPDLLGHGTAQG